MWIYLIPTNWTCTNGSCGKFYVYFIAVKTIKKFLSLIVEITPKPLTLNWGIKFLARWKLREEFRGRERCCEPPPYLGKEAEGACSKLTGDRAH